MKAHYYCGKCDYFFIGEENEAPNINRIHYKCGSRAKLLRHIAEKEQEEE